MLGACDDKLFELPGEIAQSNNCPVAERVFCAPPRLYVGALNQNEVNAVQTQTEKSTWRYQAPPISHVVAEIRVG